MNDQQISAALVESTISNINRMAAWKYIEPGIDYGSGTYTRLPQEAAGLLQSMRDDIKEFMRVARISGMNADIDYVDGGETFNNLKKYVE
jgi:hypothetical protein